MLFFQVQKSESAEETRGLNNWKKSTFHLFDKRTTLIAQGEQRPSPQPALMWDAGLITTARGC
jgi:hypothetical protein